MSKHYTISQHPKDPNREVYHVEGTLDDIVDIAVNARKLGQYDRDGASFDSIVASRKVDTRRDPWSGTRTFDDAVSLARDGWREGLEQIAAMRNTIMPNLEAALPQQQYMMDVTGFDVDVPAYLAGEPEHMVAAVDLPGNGRHYHVVVNLGASSSMDQQSMIRRGLMAAALVDALEQLGHRVTLDGLYVSRAASDNTTVVHIKRAQDALDLERVVFALAHPSMLRRIEFGVMESLDRTHRRKLNVETGTYGRPSNEWQAAYDEQPDVYIGTVVGPQSEEEIIELVLGYLREAGVVA